MTTPDTSTITSTTFDTTTTPDTSTITSTTFETTSSPSTSSSPPTDTSTITSTTFETTSSPSTSSSTPTDPSSTQSTTVQSSSSPSTYTSIPTDPSSTQFTTVQSSSSPSTYTSINSTPIVTPTSTLNIGDITSPFWIRTVCNITISTDITTTQFKSDIESKLSNAYAIAYNSIQTNGRRKRAATNGTNVLQLVSVTRITTGQVPTNLVYYIGTSDKSYVLPSTVISNMNQLSLQQMSIYLGVPVTTVATYYNSATQNPSIDEKVWIIGVVFGSLGTIALIIWLVLFVYSRCITPWDEPSIIKSSVDSPDNESFVVFSPSENTNETHIFPVCNFPKVGTSDAQPTKNTEIERENEKENKREVKDGKVSISKTKNEDIEIKNENIKETKDKSKHKSNKNDNKYVETENSPDENKSTNEIIIRHVFGESQRKHRKKHSSTSSSDSDMRSHQKSKKKTKSKKIKIKDNSRKEKVKDNYNEKPKKKRSSDEIRDQIEVNEERAISSTADIPMAFQKIDTISENIDNDKASVQEKGVAFRQINKNELTSAEDYYNVSARDHFQSPKPPEKSATHLIKVQPKSISTEDISNYDLIKPASIVNTYDPLKKFPSYSNEIFLVSDTSLNLLPLETINNLEDDRIEMKQLKSNKSNLRTLNPLPREFTKKS